GGRSGGAAWGGSAFAGDVPGAGGSSGGWLDGLWSKPTGEFSPRSFVRRQDTTRGQARRFAGRAADQVRACDQPQDRQGARPRCALASSATRRRGDRMKRRAFISLLGGAAAAWPLAASAQQSTMPVIGYLNSGPPESDASRLTGLRRGLNETGYVEGRNVVIEYRWAGNQADRLPALAADLVQLRVAVIVSPGRVATLAAKAATTSIPIVFGVANDPVQFGQFGLVATLNRPGGNLTGFNALSAELGAKALALLHELVPSIATIGFLENPNNPVSEPRTRDVLAAA